MSESKMVGTHSSASDLAFPVLTVTASGDMEVVNDLEQLQTANALAIRQGFFDNQRIIETSGDTYRVTGIRDKRSKGILLGFRFLKPRLYLVELNLEKEGNFSIEHVQKVALKGIRRFSHFWEGNLEISELENRIRATKSLQELFHLLRQ